MPPPPSRTPPASYYLPDPKLAVTADAEGWSRAVQSCLCTVRRVQRRERDSTLPQGCANTSSLQSEKQEMALL